MGSILLNVETKKEFSKLFLDVSESLFIFEMLSTLQTQINTIDV